MNQFVPFEREPTTTRGRILQATYQALHEYGYAGLSIQRIADFTDISKSSIYYHYENKDELLVAFLEQVLEDVRHGFEIESGSNPVTDLKQFVNQIFLSIDPDSDEQGVPVGAYIEIRAQAVSNEAYRERITDIDRALKEQFQSILQRGIDQDLVRDIDVDQVSEFLVTTIIGVIERYATTETVSVDRVQAEIEQYLDQRVIT